MKKKLVTLAGYAISAGLIAYLLSKTDLHSMRAGFASAKWHYLVIAAAINIAVVAMKAVRLKLIASPKFDMGFGNSFYAAMIGFAFNNIVPIRGGEVLRIHLLGKWEGFSRTSIASALGLDKMFEGVAMILLFAALSFHSSFPEWIEDGIVVILVVIILSLALALLLLRHSRRNESHEGLGRMGVVAKKLGDGLEAIADPVVAAKTLAVSLAVCATQVATIWCCQKAFGLSLEIWVPVLVFVAINFAIIIPSAPSGIGPFEAAAVIAYAWLHISTADALNIALMYHAVQFFPVTIAGGIMYHLSMRGRASANERRERCRC